MRVEAEKRLGIRSSGGYGKGLLKERRERWEKGGLSGGTPERKRERHMAGTREPLHGAAEAPPDIDLLASDVQRHVLPNGLTVLVKEVYPASVVSLSVWSRVGSLDETDDRAGLSHFLEHMLFKGTPRRPVGRIAQEVHGLGGYLNGFTSYDCTCYWIVLPSRCFAQALDIEADAILNPLLDTDEIAKEARVIVEELKMYEDRPEAFCYQQLMATAFTAHRYRRPIIGFEDVVLGTTADDLLAHYQRFYRPNNLCVTVVGDVDAAHAVAQIENALGHLEPGAVQRDTAAAEPPQRELRARHLEGDIVSGHLQMGFHIPTVHDEATLACDVLASIIGDGRSSRLYRRLRERDAVVSGVGASVFAEKDPGLLVIEAALPEARFDEVYDAVHEEIARVANDGVESSELQKAKNMVEASHVYSQETVEGLGRKLGYHEMLGDHLLAERYVGRLFGVTAEDVKQAARTYLTAANCSLVTYRPHGWAAPRRGA